MNSIDKLSAQASKIKNTGDLRYIRKILKIIHGYFDPAKYYVTTTNNLKLSRKAGLHFIMKNRLRTCGSLSYVAAVLLRRLGYKVRLVNGKRRVNRHWAQHAWIEVELKNRWQPFDLFAKNFKLSPKQNRKIRTCQSWKELSF